MIRSFLAAELPKTILERIAQLQGELKESKVDVRWVKPENIHLTLKFFGDIEESRVDEIVETVAESVRSRSPFPLQVRGMGAFPHLKDPRVVWVGLIDERGVLAPLQKEMERRLEALGFPSEGRSFQPHLTIGRLKSSRGKDELIWRIERHLDDPFGTFEVDKVVLFRSDLRPTGPIYTSLREVRFEGSEGAFTVAQGGEERVVPGYRGGREGGFDVPAVGAEGETG